MSSFRDAARDFVMGMGGWSDEADNQRAYEQSKERETKEKQSDSERRGGFAKGAQESMQVKNEEFRIGSRNANRMSRGLPTIVEPTEMEGPELGG